MGVVTRAESRSQGPSLSVMPVADIPDSLNVEVRSLDGSSSCWGVFAARPLVAGHRFRTAYGGMLFEEAAYSCIVQLLHLSMKDDVFRLSSRTGTIRTAFFLPRTKRCWPVFLNHTLDVSKENVRIVKTYGPRAKVYIEVMETLVSPNTELLLHYGPYFARVAYTDKPVIRDRFKRSSQTLSSRKRRNRKEKCLLLKKLRQLHRQMGDNHIITLAEINGL